MINEALDIWSVDPSAHKNEIARTTFLKGKLFEATGKMQKASIALKVAWRLRKEITKDDRDVKTLNTKDFDDIVAFWARWWDPTYYFIPHTYFYGILAGLLPAFRLCQFHIYDYPSQIAIEENRVACDEPSYKIAIARLCSH